jgi:hypothetical protein
VCVAPAIQDFGLANGPEGLDFAIGPGRADLSADVLNVQVAEAFAAGQRQGIQTTKGWPLALMSSRGRPQSSKHLPSQAKMGAAAAWGSMRRPITNREWSLNKPAIQVLRSMCPSSLRLVRSWRGPGRDGTLPRAQPSRHKRSSM